MPVSVPAQRLAAAAAAGRFELQRCTQCGTVQYPPREACHQCLCVDFQWVAESGAGTLMSETTLFHSHLPRFRERLPLRIGLVRLRSGPVALAFVESGTGAAPVDVQVSVQLDETGCAVMVAR